MPSIKDVPDKIEVILVEKPKEYGVFGAHGIGEPPMGPPAPTIANAVYNAVGVWIDDCRSPASRSSRRRRVGVRGGQTHEEFRPVRADHASSEAVGLLNQFGADRQRCSAAAATWSAGS